MTTDISAKLDEAIRSDNDQFGPPEHWRFSDLGKCHRYQYLKRQDVVEPAPFSPETLTLFKIGNLLEKQVLAWLAVAEGIQILSRTDDDEQVKVAAPAWDARGSLDALGIIDGEIVPVEIKSTRNRGVEAYAPMENHILQAAAYAIFLGLNRSILVYVGRDGARKVCWVHVTPQIEQRIKTEWSDLTRWWLANELPPVLPKIRSKKKVKGVWVDFTYEVNGVGFQKGEPKYELDAECGRCPYLKFCWGAAGGNTSGPEREATEEVAAID